MVDEKCKFRPIATSPRSQWNYGILMDEAEECEGRRRKEVGSEEP